MNDRGLADKIWALFEPVVVAQGYEIVEIEVHGNRSAVLRVFLDGPQGISIDQCAIFARAFSDALDVEDLIHARFVLEVSSPGLNRPLRKPAHFASRIGEEVTVKMAEAGGKVGKARGKLTLVDADAFTLTTPTQQTVRCRFDHMIAANIVYNFSQSPFASPAAKQAQGKGAKPGSKHKKAKDQEQR